MSSINFSSLDFGNASGTDRKLIDHLFMLKEQLEHTLSHLDSENFSYKFFDELTVRVQNGLNLQGVVTFEALENNATTVINGAYIKTGLVDASIFRTYAYATFENNQIVGATTSGEIQMYYVGGNNLPLLAGSLKMDYEGADTDNEALFRIILSTESIEDSHFNVALKLISEYRGSFEAKEMLYLSCDKYHNEAGNVTIEAKNNGDLVGNIVLRANRKNNTGGIESGIIKISGTVIDIKGTVRINDTVIS